MPFSTTDPARRPPPPEGRRRAVRRPRRGACTAALLACLTPGLVCLAQAQTEADAAPVSELGLRQQQLANRLADLEQELAALAADLAASDSGAAAKLRQTLANSRRRLLRERMTETADHLNRRRLSDAGDRQAALVADLQHLLQLLQNEKSEWQRLQERIEQLREWKQQTDRLAREEWGEKRDSDRLHQQEPSRAGLAANLAAAKRLLAEQQQLNRNTQAARHDPPQLARHAESQQQLAAATAALAAEIQHHQPPPGPVTPPEPGHRPLTEAASQQHAASKQLALNQPAPATARQADATAQLEEAVRQLQQAIERLDQLDAEQLRQNQEATAQATGELAAGMAKAESESGESSPGMARIAQARSAMSQAAGQLGQQQPGQASRSQQQAHRDLQQAGQEIDQEITDRREEQMDALRREFADIIRRMLAEQQTAGARTRDAHRAEEAPRREAAEAIRDQERAIRDQAVRAIAIIARTGARAAVFPALLELVRDDLGTVADQLDQSRTGAPVQELQAHIEHTLEDLLNAFENQAEQPSDLPPPPPGEPQQGQPPQPAEEQLLSPLTELKLLRARQHRLNLDTARTHADALSTERVRERQARILDLFRRLANLEAPQ